MKNSPDFEQKRDLLMSRLGKPDYDQWGYLAWCKDDPHSTLLLTRKGTLKYDAVETSDISKFDLLLSFYDNRLNYLEHITDSKRQLLEHLQTSKAYIKDGYIPWSDWTMNNFYEIGFYEGKEKKTFKKAKIDLITRVIHLDLPELPTEEKQKGDL
jgi:hypothetical protein